MPDFTLSPEEVLGLPLDQLGLAVLKDLVANNETNEVNWLQAAARTYRPDTVQALAEAWAWLHQTGLVANGQQTMYTAGLIFVTRLGRQVARGSSQTFDYGDCRKAAGWRGAALDKSVHSPDRDRHCLRRVREVTPRPWPLTTDPM